MIKFNDLHPAEQQELLEYLSALPFPQNAMHEILISINADCVTTFEFGTIITAHSFFTFSDQLAKKYRK